MQALAIHATKNEPPKRDATGAFVPEAREFAKFWACHREGFDNFLPKTERAKSVEAILDRYRGLEMIAFFGHGFRTGLQSGHGMSNVGSLAKAIARATGPRVYVVLYACSTAGVISVERGGFADALRDELTKLGKTGHVDGHTTAAHTVWNPMLQRFDMGDPFEEIVGDWVVTPPDLPNPERKTNPRAARFLPADPEWSMWKKRLRADKDPFCYRFPTMTIQDIRSELRG